MYRKKIKPRTTSIQYIDTTDVQLAVFSLKITIVDHDLLTTCLVLDYIMYAHRYLIICSYNIRLHYINLTTKYYQIVMLVFFKKETKVKQTLEVISLRV